MFGLIIALVLAAVSSPAAAQSENVRALEKLCGGGDTLSCTNLAVLLKHGRGTPRDDPRALTLFLSACEKGVDFACGNVGEMTFKGRGIAVNQTQGSAIIKGACLRGDNWSCDTARLLGIKIPKKTPV